MAESFDLVDVQEFKNPINRHPGPLNPQIQIHQHLQGTEGPGLVGREGHQPADAQLPVDHQIASVQGRQCAAQEGGRG